MLDHLPCALLCVAPLLRFPLGKCGRHHSPALQVSLVRGFEEMVQHNLVTDVYFMSVQAHQAKTNQHFKTNSQISFNLFLTNAATGKGL